MSAYDREVLNKNELFTECLKVKGLFIMSIKTLSTY